MVKEPTVVKFQCMDLDLWDSETDLFIYLCLIVLFYVLFDIIAQISKSSGCQSSAHLECPLLFEYLQKFNILCACFCFSKHEEER